MNKVREKKHKHQWQFAGKVMTVQGPNLWFVCECGESKHVYEK